MFYISEIFKDKPKNFKTELQRAVYNTLERIGIQYERVDTDEAITMDDCVLINKKLNVKMVKHCFCATGTNIFCSLPAEINVSIPRVSALKCRFREFHLHRKIKCRRCLEQKSVPQRFSDCFSIKPGKSKSFLIKMFCQKNITAAAMAQQQGI